MSVLRLNALREVKARALELAVDEQAAANTCPFCEAPEKSFSLQRTMTHAVYCCHRSSCDTKGAIPMMTLDMTGVHGFRGKPIVVPTPEELEFSDLPEDKIKYLKEKYFLTPEEMSEADFRWIPKKNRLWMPILKWDGLSIGGVMRSLESGVKPKTITHLWHPHHPLGSWYVKGFPKPDTVWIVEDQLSALRMSRYVDAVALLGTNLSDGLLKVLREKYKHVVIALDKDAFNKALDIQKLINPILDTKVYRPAKDFKNMNPDELKEALGV